MPPRRADPESDGAPARAIPVARRAAPPSPGRAEFAGLAASLMVLFAMSIDLILPALPDIAAEMGISRANDQQHIVSLVILGMGIGQVFYGPLSDSLGRKPAILVGLGLFAIGCVVALLATDFEQLLLGRLLQGLGAAGPRIVTLALVRDRYEGPEMARFVSIVVTVLMVGPLLAPFAGQGLLRIASWRSGFALLLALDLAILVWLVLRQPETLPRSRRLPASWGALAAALREVTASRAPLGYTLAGGIAFGQLFAYVSSAPQIFEDLYGVGAWFPACFAASGVSIAAASLLNTRLVGRFGMRVLCRRAAAAGAAVAALFLVAAWPQAGPPALWTTLLFFSATFFCVGILFGNLSALAMEPLGHVAGVAAGLVGSLTWGVAACLAAAIGQLFDGTLVPLAAAYLGLGLALMSVLAWVEKTQ